uniref:Aldose 1-epimerase n=1 Tax=Microscilla sp. PRE1 TaxID=155537 RepID=Q93P86_9BACT|nr:aldose epimerase family protein [Microscilla sp. PRE1]AAK62867.1 MS145, putative aldose epimerase [Microscilla sp. PRE1]
MVNKNKTYFGEYLGKQVYLYTLVNNCGMEVKITNYGATITSILLPIKGKKIEVVCGFDRLESYFTEVYKSNAPYFGSTIGRYCSHIKNAKFTHSGKEYLLTANAGSNNLHGGMEGFDKRVWEVLSFDQSSLTMGLTSPDGDQGFPGKVEVTVCFTLNDNNEILIKYEGVVDQETPLSMTNHAYFNLTGFEEGIENHQVKINASQRLETDETGAATGTLLEISNQPDDLRGYKRIGDVREQLGDGFEHFYVFDNPEGILQEVCQVASPGNEVILSVHSTEPSMLFYTGKYTSDELHRENGQQFGKFRAFCCETHRYPNGPNIPGSPGTFTGPDEPFVSETHYKFLIINQKEK